MRTALFLSGLTAVFFFIACGDDTPSQAHEDDTPVQSSSSINENSSARVSSSSSQKGSSNSEISSSEVSSSESTSSSSTTPESSESTKYAANYNPETRLLTDERDGEIYKTAEIGEQIWMAENLRYVPTEPVEGCDGLGVAIQEDSIKHATYGNYYSWVGAMRISCDYTRDYAILGKEDPITAPRQGVCPNGWHLPVLAEWQALFDFVKDPVKLLSTSWTASGYTGLDSYGFNVLPIQENENFPVFLAFEEASNNENVMISFLPYSERLKVSSSTSYKHTNSQYVRCLMDEPHPTHVINE